MTRAVVAIGSNIDPAQHLVEAVRRLRGESEISVLALSDTYRSPAVDRPEQNHYLNAAALVETDLAPTELRSILRSIEAEMGRVRSDDRWAAREIDLDLVLFEGFAGDVEGSPVPDPALTRYPHVALPVADVAEDWEVEPGHTVGHAAGALDREGVERIMGKEIANRGNGSRYAPETRMEAEPDEVYDPQMEANVRAQLEYLGEDPTREGLLRTPLRVAKAMDFLTSGYTQSLDEIVNNALFEADADEMVLVKDIEFYSLCEHHMLPFFGKAAVAYLPDGKVIGVSKIARIVDLFARRLQIQERLTNQIADAIEDVLEPHGVAVVMDGAHFCMMMRGVQKQGSSMVTSAMRGGFKHNDSTRAEFMDLIQT